MMLPGRILARGMMQTCFVLLFLLLSYEGAEMVKRLSGEKKIVCGSQLVKGELNLPVEGSFQLEDILAVCCSYVSVMDPYGK